MFHNLTTVSHTRIWGGPWLETAQRLHEKTPERGETEWCVARPANVGPGKGGPGKGKLVLEHNKIQNFLFQLSNFQTFKTFKTSILEKLETSQNFQIFKTSTLQNFKAWKTVFVQPHSFLCVGARVVGLRQALSRVGLRFFFPHIREGHQVSLHG